MTRALALWEYLRGTYWAVPSAMALAAIALSFGMVQVDQLAAASVMEEWSLVFTGGPEGARAVLSTIASSMITVAGVSFSITIVALTLASQQFGPRLLRNFLRDLGNQIVLGTFVSTFIYCLLVLRTVRGTDNGNFVPHLSVTFGVVLAIVSLGVLIYFFHHIATSIQASQIIANVAHDLDDAIDEMFPESLGSDPPPDSEDDAGWRPGADAAEVRARSTGYIQAIDAASLMKAACAQNVTVMLQERPGAFVRQGEVLMSVDGALADASALADAIIIGRIRTATQDVTFFVDQLVELAVRALSPGVNDPGTARVCVDRLEQALCLLAGRQMPSARRYDDGGRLRVVAPPVLFTDVAQNALADLIRHSRSSVSVTLRLLDAMTAIGTCLRRESDRKALVEHARALEIASRSADLSDIDRQVVSRSYRKALMALHEPAADSP